MGEGKKQAILEFMEEDFNTAGVSGQIFDWVRQTNSISDPKELSIAATEWKELQLWLGDLLGVFHSSAADYKERIRKIYLSKSKVDSAHIEQLLKERNEARKKKDFKKSDAIRDQLLQMGVDLKDRPDGTTEWHVK